MKSADRELIRLTAQIYIEHLKKWPDGEAADHVIAAEQIARDILSRTYEKDQSAKIHNLECDLSFYRAKIAKLNQEIAALKSDDDVACQHDWIKTPYGSKCVLCHEETAADMRVKAF